MRRRSHESGQAMVEYALTALVFFTLVLFIVDGSRILWNYVTVSYAARIGARYGITHGSKSTAPMGPGGYSALQQVVRDSATGLDPANLTITASWTPDNTPGSRVNVVVTYRAQGVTDLFWRGLTLNLRGESSMIIQN